MLRSMIRSTIKLKLEGEELECLRRPTNSGGDVPAKCVPDPHVHVCRMHPITQAPQLAAPHTTRSWHLNTAAFKAAQPLRPVRVWLSLRAASEAAGWGPAASG
jgi:hypothetical protein